MNWIDEDAEGSALLRGIRGDDPGICRRRKMPQPAEVFATRYDVDSHLPVQGHDRRLGQFKVRKRRQHVADVGGAAARSNYDESACDAWTWPIRCGDTDRYQPRLVAAPQS